METTKTCSKCGKSLPLENFSKNNQAKDGLAYYCRECEKKRRADSIKNKADQFPRTKAIKHRGRKADPEAVTSNQESDVAKLLVAIRRDTASKIIESIKKEFDL